MEKNIFELSAIDKNKELWKNKKVVLVGGCFDILHYGHVTFLKKAKEQGNYLIVALESDEFIRTRKKREPVHNQQQRAEILIALAVVDAVVRLPLMAGNDAYFNLVKDISPTVIAVTEGDSMISLKQKQAQQVGGELKVVSPSLTSFSTSSIIAYETIFSS